MSPPIPPNLFWNKGLHSGSLLGKLSYEQKWEWGQCEVGGGKAVQEWATELVTTGGSWAATLPGSLEELCAVQNGPGDE